MTKEQVRFQVAVSVIQGIIEGKHGIIGEVVPAAAVDEAFRIADQFTKKWFEKYEGEENGVTESKALIEDEKIRKALIELVCSDVNDLIGGVEKRLCVSYLEKQKEQKPALYWHKIKANDHLPCKAYIYKFAYEQENNFHGRATINGYLVPNEPVTIGCDTWYLPVEDIKNLPKEEDLDTVSPMKTVEQKPALRLVGDGLISDPNAHFELEGEQKPAEWSEEDERNYEFVEGALVGCYGYNFRKNLVNWLKSLRPHPHWKPSEEQMGALKYALGEGGKFDKAALESLYNDIKSL